MFLKKINTVFAGGVFVSIEFMTPDLRVDCIQEGHCRLSVFTIVTMA